MATTSRKASTKRSVKAPRPRQKVRQISVIDRVFQALPFSEEDIQRAATWLIIAAMTVLAFAAAQWAGLTTAAYLQYSDLPPRAGSQV